ncbi:hypothetical protein ACFL0R_03660 [Pseudomonadota bacterium]
MEKRKKRTPPGVLEGAIGDEAERTVTEEDLKSSVTEHVAERARAIRDKYGPDIDYPTLLEILEDRESVRYPVTILFDTSRIDPGMFAFSVGVFEEPEMPEGEDEDFADYVKATGEYDIVVHEAFKDRLDVLPALVLYHLVAVNYADLATATDAEIFGSTVLGMDQDDYYALLCEAVDSLS